MKSRINMYIHNISEKDIRSCLSNNIPNLENYVLSKEGCTEYGEGFVCDVFYVSLVEKNNGKKCINLVIKSLKPINIPRKSNPFIPLFMKEVFVYTEVYPVFNIFEEKIRGMSVFKGIPKCFGCSTAEGKEMIILENLKPKGFNIRQKGNPYTVEETKLVLAEMGEWHAFSFALKDQRPHVFEKLALNKSNIFGNLCKASNLYNRFHDAYVRSIPILEGHIDDAAFNVYKNLESRYDELLMCKADKKIKYAVVSHGDSWSNNFLFKYEESKANIKKPTDVCIIDWQCSSITLPVFDIAHFLYGISEKQHFDRMFEILKSYYDSVSSSIRAFGSSPEMLYPEKEFWDQWKEYSGHGMILTPFCLAYLHSSSTANQQNESGKDIENWFPDFIPDNVDKYRQALIEYVEHYVKFQS